LSFPPSPFTALVDFVASSDDAPPLRAAFGTPRERLVARTPSDVRRVLDAAMAHARAGRWCVGAVRYEAAKAFDAACEVHEHDGVLASFSVHDEALPWPQDVPERPPSIDWRSPLTRADFEAGVSRVHRAIADGEVYQVNLTAPWQGRLDTDALSLFLALQRAQPQSYAAYFDDGHEQIASVSPELFFDWREGRVLCRPMKGTAPRGATPEKDAALSASLLASPKERAENLMIVDLIRNDLSRIAVPHGVQVGALFERRAWPTVWQMTTDVRARTREGLSLSSLFEALFPCGSVTGAPKLRAVHWIRRLEPAPRGVYCGAIGVLQPGGAATFSVGIRTVALRGSKATCGIGSGLTADARADEEWREWQHKRAFLDRASAPFELLQTMRLEAGVFPARELHLARLAAAAAHFGRAFDAGAAQAALRAVASERRSGTWRVRLRIDPQGRAQAEAFAHADTPSPLRVNLADRPIDAAPALLRHKTTRRSHYEAFAPVDDSVFDTLLWNARGELTEFTRGNLIAQREDGRWVTPSLHCGLLDGVGRALALQRGEVVEDVVRLDELPRLRALRFVNALRGELPVRL